MASDFQVSGTNTQAPFSLRVHRGDGMALLAMDWKGGRPPDDFAGFAIEYQEPNRDRWYAVQNRLTFAGVTDDETKRSSLIAPIQKFRWVHFPRFADLPGAFHYRVSPVFMSSSGTLSLGEAQVVPIELRRETHPGVLNVTFTRGFVSSQAFTERFAPDGKVVVELLPGKAADGLTFVPKASAAKEKAALEWMGFEARDAILEVLDGAVADATAQVRVVAYDLNEPEVVTRLEALGARLKVVIDDSDDHGADGSAEDQAEARLKASGAEVKRQHMGDLQHNKTIVVTGAGGHHVVCGSTNFSWRGFYVQNNNALVLHGASAVAPFLLAFDQYWASSSTTTFGKSPAAGWTPLGLPGVDAQVAFSPHSAKNALLEVVGDDVAQHTTSSLFYSLAFLGQTGGPIRDAVDAVTNDPDIFVFGMADSDAGIVVQDPDGNPVPVKPSALTDAPAPFKNETSGGSGIRLHHKFLVVDFDQPTARVYLGSYNFSEPADRKNGENLLLVRDRRVAVAYMIEAVRIFDHYQWRNRREADEKAGRKKPKGERLELQKPPKAGEKAWWARYYEEPARIRDRLLFAGSS